jgi:hypothetical protein
LYSKMKRVRKAKSQTPSLESKLLTYAMDMVVT